jgi:hypothetical protein
LKRNSILIPTNQNIKKKEKGDDEEINMDAIDEESFSEYSDQDGDDNSDKGEGEV